MTGLGFFTITDRLYFPGTVATVNSVLLFHPHAHVFVVECQTQPLTPAQRRWFAQSSHVEVVNAQQLVPAGAVADPWSLKAHAASWLLPRCDMLTGIDSDCLLCSNIDDVIERCRATGGFAISSAPGGFDYDASYEVYGFAAPAQNPRHLVTSLFVAARTPANKRLVDRWSHCCRSAVFNGTGPHPGSSYDEGVLNALLFAEPHEALTQLDGALWGPHRDYWASAIERDGRQFVNRAAGGQRQRAIHTTSPIKLWSRAHRDRIVTTCPMQTSTYAWYLAMLWFGPCTHRAADAGAALPAGCDHLWPDLVQFLPVIFQVHPPARLQWRQVGGAVAEQALGDIPRLMTVKRLTDVVRLIDVHLHVRRCVEVGSYEGALLLGLALRFQHRDIHFYAVDSFAGSLDGSVDGHPLASRRRYTERLQRFPALRVRLVPGDSTAAAALFDDGSVDFVFIDARHDTVSVLDDIDAWQPKIAAGGLIAGDDYGLATVQAAVDRRFPDAQVTAAGGVWWYRLPDSSCAR